MALAYRHYVLGVLLLVYVVNFIDRQILAILLPLIKADLQLSDTQLGFLGGIAFAIFYVTVGLPIAWLADRRSRRKIISVAVFVWSALTAATGFAGSFLQMVLLRIGVGVGEAGCTPPAHSLISDYFPAEERGTAMAIYNLGFSFGVLIGFAAGGFIGEQLGWRPAFILAGLPGLGLAVLVWYTVREPARGQRLAAAQSDAPPARETLRFLFSQRAFLHLAAAASLTNLGYVGALLWIPSFFVRSHALGTAEIGAWLAVLTGIIGGVGTFAGGWLTDRLGERDRRWYFWLPAIGTLAATPFVPAVFFASTATGAFALFAAPAFFVALGVAPIYAMTQGLAKPRMRALAAALMLFVINLLGMGAGPQIVGLLSDVFAPELGQDALRWAIASVMTIGVLWPALHFLMGARTLRADLDRALDRH